MTNKWRLEGDLEKNLAGMENQHKAAIIAAANFAAPQIESFMKSNARWTDRTGAARNGLRAKVYASGNKCAIVLYHSVDYGVWLEVRWGGKYAIIERSIQFGGPIFVKAIGATLFRR